jgi:phage-related protein
MATEKALAADASLAEVQRELRRFDMDAVELIQEETDHQSQLLTLEIQRLAVSREFNADAIEKLKSQRELVELLGQRKLDQAEGGTIFGNLIRQMDKAKDSLKSQFGDTFAQAGKLFDDVSHVIKKSTDGKTDIRVSANPAELFDNIVEVARYFGQQAGESIEGFLDQTPEEIYAQLKAGAKEVGLFIWDAFDASVTFLVNNIDDAFEFGADMLGGAFASGAADMLEGLAGFTDVWTDAFKRIEKSLSTLLDSFPKAIQQVISKIPDIAAKFAAAAPEIARALANAAPALTTAIVKAMPMIIKAVADGLVILMAALPDIIDQLAKGLPGIIRALAEALPRVFDALVQAMPAIAEALADNAGPIAEALAEGLIYASGRIVASLVKHLLMDGGLERIAGAILRGIRDGLIGLIKGIGKGFGALFGGMKIEIPDIDKLKDAGKAIKEAFTGDKSGLFSVKDLTDEAQGSAREQATQLSAGIKDGMIKAGVELRGLMDQLLSAWRAFWDHVVEMWRALWDGIVNVWLNLWDGLTKGWQALWDGIVNVWRAFWDGITAGWRAAFDAVASGLTGFLTNLWSFVTGLPGAISSAFQSVVTLFGSLGTTVSDAFKSVLDLFGGKAPAISGNITSAFAPIVAIFGGASPSITGAVSTAFGPVMTVFGGATPSLTTTVSNAWKPVTDIFGGKAPSLTATVDNAFKPVTDIFGGKAPTLGTTVSTAFNPILTFKWPSIPGLPASISDFKWPSVPKLPSSIDDFKWPSLPSLPPSIKDFKWPVPSLPSSFTGFKWPDFPNADAAGRNIGAGFWNKLVELNVGTLGSNMGDGMWNKLITFNWSSLFPKPKWLAQGGLVQGYATGGVVNYLAGGDFPMFQPKGTDTVPAMLTPGEFVVNARATRANLPALRSMNSGQPFGGNNSTVIIQKIEINGTNLTPDQIAAQVIPKIDQHLKRKSQDGGFVVSKAGIRS